MTILTYSLLDKFFLEAISKLEIVLKEDCVITLKPSILFFGAINSMKNIHKK